MLDEGAVRSQEWLEACAFEAVNRDFLPLLSEPARQVELREVARRDLRVGGHFEDRWMQSTSRGGIQVRKRQVGEVDPLAHRLETEVQRQAAENVEAASSPCHKNAVGCSQLAKEWQTQEGHRP